MKLKSFLYIAIFIMSGVSCNKDNNDEPEERGTIVIDFSETTIEESNTLYHQDNLTLNVIETTVEDCREGRCSFGCCWEGRLGLFPARMEIDLNKISDITGITVTGNDNCARNCTRFFLYDGNRNVIQTASLDQGLGDYSISFDSELDNVKYMAISSCEGSVGTITID
jgi:hypothetical protein